MAKVRNGDDEINWFDENKLIVGNKPNPLN